MNGRQCRDLLRSWAACFPDLRFERLAAWAARVERARPAARWEAGVSSGEGYGELRVRVSGAEPELLRLSARELGCAPHAAAGHPRPGTPWLEARWDAREEKASLSVCAGRRQRFSPSALGPELAAPLADFARLAPVSDVYWDSEGVSLRLAGPIGWPDFLALDLSKPFTPKSDQLSLLLRDGEVREVALRGDRLWAYLGS